MVIVPSPMANTSAAEPTEETTTDDLTWRHGGGGGGKGGGGGLRVMLLSRWRSELFCLVLIAGYWSSFSDKLFFMFVVSPGYILPPNCWIWTCFTHSFVEVHWWIVASDVVVVLFQGSLLGSSMSSTETVVFYVVVNVLVGLLTALTYVSVFLLTQDTYYLFDVSVNGLAGYLAGVSVALKKVMPDRVILSLSSHKFLCGQLPLLVLVFSVLLRKIGVVEASFPVMFSWGLAVSWVYLRFQRRIVSWICLRVCGKPFADHQDDSDVNFSLTSFLPQFIRSMLTISAAQIRSLLPSKSHLLRHPERSKNSTGIPV